MARAKASASPSVQKTFLGSASSASTDHPVPSASRNTTSESTSSVCGLSTTGASARTWRTPSVVTRLGPMPPKLMGTELEPGPPLYAKVTGRAASGLPSPSTATYESENIRPMSAPASSRTSRCAARAS